MFLTHLRLTRNPLPVFWSPVHGQFVLISTPWLVRSVVMASTSVCMPVSKFHMAHFSSTAFLHRTLSVTTPRNIPGTDCTVSPEDHKESVRWIGKPRNCSTETSKDSAFLGRLGRNMGHRSIADCNSLP